MWVWSQFQFRKPSISTEEPMFTRLTLLALFSVVGACASLAQTANITFLHNSADPAMAVIDVYITQYGSTSKVEDLEYQKGTSFSDAIIFGGFEVFIDVAPSTSSSKDEAIATLTFTPQPDAGYHAELSGVRGESGWVANPDGKNISLQVRQVLVPNPTPVGGQTDVMFSHGATDLEACDVWLRGASSALFTNNAYGQTTPTPKKVERVLQTIDLTKVGDKTKVLASFAVDFSMLSSDVAILTLSGFNTPGDNNGSTNALTLLAVLDDGSVVKYELQSGSQTARVQFIHDSPDPSLGVVDVWVNGERKYNDLGFRKASGFSDLAAGSPVVIGVAPATSTTINDTTFSISLPALRPGRSYHFVLQGLADTSKFQPNPTGAPLNLTIITAEGALEQSATDGKTSVRMIHGAPDLAPVYVASSRATYAESIAYGEVGLAYVPVEPVQQDTIWVMDVTDSTRWRGWVADLRGNNRAVAALISGFVQPDSNMNGPQWKIILVDANGGVNDRLVEVDTGNATSVLELIPHSLWTIAPNPASSSARFSIPLTDAQRVLIGNEAHAMVVDPQGSLIKTIEVSFGAHQATGVVSLDQVPAGSYFIRVVGGSGIVVGTAPLRIVR